MNKKKIGLAVLALALCIGLASAALLDYFAKIESTVNVEQGVKVDGHSYDDPVIATISTVGHGINYSVHSITNYGDLPTTVTFDSEVLNATTKDPITGELSVDYFINSGTLVLENKDGSPNWNIIEGDGRYAILTYDIVGTDFAYNLKGFGLNKSISYSLIYYADQPDRYVNWGGDNPGALIGSAIADTTGDLVMIGSVDLTMDLPSPPDANIKDYNYTEAPDFYDHAHGAKIWLVPTTYLPDTWLDDGSWEFWNPEIVSNILFETDLISYINLDVSPHLGIHPDPATITELTIPAHTTINFVIRVTADPATYGNYSVITTVSP